MSRWWVVLVAFSAIAGCSPGASGPGDERVMTDARHSHYHVHAPGIAHGHTHADFASGGHTHEHDGH